MTPFSTPLVFQLRTFLSRCAAVLLSVFLASAGAAWADPPARAGRIADVSGTVWLFDPDTKAWNRVLRNQTIGQGDQLRTGANARVTVRMGSSTAWLDEQTDLLVWQMDDSAVLLRLLKGDLALRLRTEEAADETRVQTREGVTAPERAGLIRVGQNDRGTRVAVEEGRIQFNSDPAAAVQRAWLGEGEQAEFVWAGPARVERRSMRSDAFGAWFSAQDEAEERLSMHDESYVSPEMTGAEELSQYGEWEVAEEYGNVWIPTRVAAGWEPYRDGRWVWTRHWGWSWVDNAPWGFAPFHYGRWVQHHNRWAWAPGRFERRPAYSPALVTWSGGAHLRVEIGGGRRPPPTHWSPLPAYQAYVPHHDHTSQYAGRFRWDRGSADERRDERRTRPSTRPLPHRQTAPLPTVQTDQPNWRAPTTSPYPNRDRTDRDERDERDGRDSKRNRNDHNDRNDRNDRNRDVQQLPQYGAPVTGQPHTTPSQSATPPSGFVVPLFNRDGGGTGPAQSVQRPTPSVTRPPVAAPVQQATPASPFTPPVVAAPAPTRQRPATVDEDESPKVRNNKLRDRQERAGQERDGR